jgi:hypothetical protein
MMFLLLLLLHSAGTILREELLIFAASVQQKAFFESRDSGPLKFSVPRIPRLATTIDYVHPTIVE